MLETVSVVCPYCATRQKLVIDISPGDQEYIEDCTRCCRPMTCSVIIDTSGELQQVSVRCDDD